MKLDAYDKEEYEGDTTITLPSVLPVNLAQEVTNRRELIELQTSNRETTIVDEIAHYNTDVKLPLRDGREVECFTYYYA